MDTIKFKLNYVQCMRLANAIRRARDNEFNRGGYDMAKAYEADLIELHALMREAKMIESI